MFIEQFPLPFSPSPSPGNDNSIVYFYIFNYFIYLLFRGIRFELRPSH
jgi:hypothetical protein